MPDNWNQLKKEITMRRLYKRTHLETCGSDSVWMKAVDKGLVAQIEIVPGADEHDVIVEHWRTREDKDADLQEERNKAAGDTGCR